jgi:hypothetical protein
MRSLFHREPALLNYRDRLLGGEYIGTSNQFNISMIDTFAMITFLATKELEHPCKRTGWENRRGTPYERVKTWIIRVGPSQIDIDIRAKLIGWRIVRRRILSTHSGCMLVIQLSRISETGRVGAGYPTSRLSGRTATTSERNDEYEQPRGRKMNNTNKYIFLEGSAAADSRSFDRLRVPGLWQLTSSGRRRSGRHCARSYYRSFCRKSGRC